MGDFIPRHQPRAGHRVPSRSAAEGTRCLPGRQAATTIRTRWPAGPTRWAGSLALAAVVATLVACGGSTGTGTGEPASTATATATPTMREVIAKYTRFGQAGDERDLELTYAPPSFFETFNQDVPPEVANGEAMMFLLRENVHDGELPEQMVQVAVRRPGGELVLPSSVDLLTDGVHHRSARLVFPVAPAGIERVEVVVVRHGEIASGTTPFVWTTPGAPATSAAREGS